MSRPLVQLHTIEQWFQVDPSVRSVVLQNIKLKDRLSRWLMANPSRIPLPPEGMWVPCKSCDSKGWKLKEPRNPGIHPSQLPHPCLLKIYWQMEGREEREEISPRTRLIFDVGHAVHAMLQKYGRDGAWGKHYFPETHMTEGSHPLATELMVEGHADAENILTIDDIPNAPIFEVGLVHEYKTINSKNFAKLTSPKPEHKKQAILYAGVLNRPVVVYLYLNKDDQNLADFPIEFNLDEWNATKQKAQLLVDHYNREVPPEASPGYKCQECGFAFNCPALRAHQQRTTLAARR